MKMFDKDGHPTDDADKAHVFIFDDEEKPKKLDLKVKKTEKLYQ